MLQADDIDLLAPLESPISGPLMAIGALPRTVTPDDLSEALSGWISEAQFSALIGLSSRRVRDLVRDGVLTKTIKNRRLGFVVPGEIIAYCAFLRDRFTARGQTDDLKNERVRKERAAAEKLELQNAAIRGEMVAVNEVRAEWGNLVRDVRAGMLAVPARVGAALPHLGSHDIATIDAEVRAALEAISHDA